MPLRAGPDFASAFSEVQLVSEPKLVDFLQEY